MRLAIGIAAGLITAALWIALIQGLGQWLFAPPGGPDDIGTMPLAGQVWMVFAWCASAFAGGAVANATARRWWAATIVAGAVIAFASALTLLSPHPMWLRLAGVAGPLVAAELANRFTRAWTT